VQGLVELEETVKRSRKLCAKSEAYHEVLQRRSTGESHLVERLFEARQAHQLHLQGEQLQCIWTDWKDQDCLCVSRASLDQTDDLV
jgi:hypothetical protein